MNTTRAFLYRPRVDDELTVILRSRKKLSILKLDIKWLIAIRILQYFAFFRHALLFG